MRGCFRVNYQENGSPKTGFVVASTDVEAATHFGVASQSGVQVTKALYPVEVAGLDAGHAVIPSLPVNVAPFDISKSVSRADFNMLQQQISDLQAQLAGSGKKV